MPVYVNRAENREKLGISSSSLQEHVRMLSEELIPRTCEQPTKLKNSADYVESEFLKWNSNTTLQTYQFNGAEFSNIISSYGPKTEEVIIVGAHYDAFASLPGADDNASGVAGLLELGRMLSSVELETNVLLIAYACEEPPYFAGPGMGSYFHANSIGDRDVTLMISLEMIGYFTSSSASQEFPISLLSYLYTDKGDFIAIVGNMLDLNARGLKATIEEKTDIEAYSINAPMSMPGIDFSDHRNYWSLNYPAVMVTDTAFYRNANYHTARDTVDTLNYEKMKEVVRGVYFHVVKLANKTQ